MGNFKNRVTAFMYGRYGIDQLYYALMVAYLILLAVGLFYRSIAVSALMWAVLILSVFRVFSRNTYRRSRENAKFMVIWNRVRGAFSLMIRRVREIRTRRYRKCPHCRSMLRLPRRTGKHTVECPRCHRDFEVRIRW